MFKKTTKISECVYKSVHRDWIVTLERLPDTVFAKLYTTTTDDDMYREHLINKAKIVKIQHKQTNEQKESIVPFYYQSSLTRMCGSGTVNQIIYDECFDDKLMYRSDYRIDGRHHSV